MSTRRPACTFFRRTQRERHRCSVVSAHRGFSSEAPENTLPALATALTAGADIAEIDIRMTSDHVLVLMHDALLDRTTDGAGPVSAITLADLKRHAIDLS